MPSPARESIIASIVKSRPAVQKTKVKALAPPRLKDEIQDEMAVPLTRDKGIEDYEPEDGSPIVSKDLMRALKAPKAHAPVDELLFTPTERRQIAKDNTQTQSITPHHENRIRLSRNHSHLGQ